MDTSPQPILTEETPQATARTKRRNLLVGAALVLFVIGVMTLLNLPSTRTQGVGTYRNYSADAMIRGGAITEQELLQKYDQNASGIQNIFHHYGITRSDLTEQTSDIKHGIVYQDGRVVVGGKTVATGAFSVSRKPFYDDRGNAPRKVTINGTVVYEGPNMSIFVRAVDAYVLFRDGQFYKAIISSCANPVMGTPVVPKKLTAQPVYSCDSLQAKQLDRTRYRFTAGATAKNGASVHGYVYDFGDGTTATGDNVSEHTYAEPGDYTVTVKANIDIDGDITTVPGGNCETTVTVEQPPKTPVYACTSLTAHAIQGQDRTYTYMLRYTAESGAHLTKAVYDFGDGNSEEFNEDNVSGVEHRYETPGRYTAAATLYFDVDGEGETSASCSVTFTVLKPDTCTLPGKEDLPKNSPECVEPLIETPPELPKTGFGEFLAGATGLAALVAAIYYWNVSDKNLKHTMIHK